MMRFIKRPNLPEGKTGSLICGGLNDEIISYFEKRNIEIIYTDENPFVDKSVSRHADLSVLYLGDGTMIVDRGQSTLIKKLRADGYEVIETEKIVKGPYPNDCLLNHTLTDRYIIGNPKVFDPIVEKLTGAYELLSVRQGYCKCSVLVIDDTSFITDDEATARKINENGLDCLLISKGDVFLEGHDYGFIGGASGKISNNEVVFFGDITKHRDYYRIITFLEKREMHIISFDFPLTDFGGIIPIKENIF